MLYSPWGSMGRILRGNRGVSTVSTGVSPRVPGGNDSSLGLVSLSFFNYIDIQHFWFLVNNS